MKFSSLVGYSHPTIWKAIECFRADTASVESILIRMDRGFVPLEKKRKFRIDTEARLKNLCQQRIADTKTIQECLHSISMNFRENV